MAGNPSDEQWQAIDADLFAGRKIQAMKKYRIATGAELKEAKEFVEARESEKRVSSPEIFQPAGAKGCMSVLLVVAFFALLILVLK